MTTARDLDLARTEHRAAANKVDGLEQAARIAAAPGFDPDARDLILDELEAARTEAARLAGEYAAEVAARAARRAAGVIAPAPYLPGDRTGKGTAVRR